MIIQQPATEAAITMLVPEGHRERANAVKEMAFPLAGVVAPILAGFLYTLIDVIGIIAIDLLTFGMAVLVVFLVHIPRPRQTEEGRQAHGNWRQELAGGLRFLASRRALLGLVFYLTLTNFLLNGPLELSLPYIATVTGSESMVGILMGVMSLGALAGAALIAVWGGTRPRIHTLLPGLALTGLMMIVYGMARTPLLLAIALFTSMIPLPAGNALFTSILQIKTPPDMQGRVFAVAFQLFYLAATGSFLATGSLVDDWIEPAVGGPGWAIVEPLVGRTAGAGMGLVLVVAGAVILVTASLVYALPQIRRLEVDLPDYTAIPESTED
jgi:MFS family permease